MIEEGPFCQKQNISLSQNPKFSFITQPNPLLLHRFLMKNTYPENPSPFKKKLASRFLKAMKKLKYKISSSPSMAEKSKRYHAVRAAAYASMASAVGPRKAWSRALLRKIRNHKHKLVMLRGIKRPRQRNPRNIDTRFGLNDLSDVVPGGKAMDSCSLLNETGHYIKCLRAQVQIMREILDSSSRIL